MSFYQPSLSLFDVLNALSDQTRQRDPQQRVNQRHPRHGPNGHFYPGVGPAGAGAPPHPHGHPHHGHGLRGPYPTARSDIFNPFGGVYDSPAGYFYRDPQDNYYYSPQYDEETEGETSSDEEGDQRMGGTESEENPSYYHTRDGSRDRTEEADDIYQRRRKDYLNDLFNAFTGTEPRYAEESSDEEQGETAAKAKGPETKESKPTEEQPAKKPEANTANTTTSKTTKTPEQPKTKEAKTEKAPQKPKLKKRVSSHAHLSAPSPIPDPLQISKPETRLDLPFTPEVNVYDLKTEYVVVLALPGASSKAFKVDYHPSSHELLVKGNVIDRLGIEEKYLKITEIKYGAFERTIKFPVLPRIKDDEIKAKYSNGLLQIKVPKMEGPSDKPVPKKRITIEDIPDAELEFEKNPNPVEKI